MLGVALFAQLAIAANGPDTATACLPLRVSAAIRTPGRTAPVVEPPQGSGLQLLRSRVSSRVESDGAAQFSDLTVGAVESAHQSLRLVTNAVAAKRRRDKR